MPRMAFSTPSDRAACYSKDSIAGPLGAAYTPLAIDAQGRVYAQTGGHLFAVGGAYLRKRAVR